MTTIDFNEVRSLRCACGKTFTGNLMDVVRAGWILLEEPPQGACPEHAGPHADRLIDRMLADPNSMLSQLRRSSTSERTNESNESREMLHAFLVDVLSKSTEIPAPRRLHEESSEDEPTKVFPDGELTIPTEPGLYALMSPDNIMVRVVDRTISRKNLRSIIDQDLVRRVCRDDYADMAWHNIPSEEVTRRMLPRHLGLRKQYRLEKLSGSS